MALGTNYRRTGDKEDRRRENNLEKHYVMMQKFMAEGMSKGEASKKAFRIVTGMESK